MPNFTCPSASQENWHACGAGSQFVGCCKQDDPCALGCSAGNLAPASFDVSLFGKIPDLECGAGARFYTCNATTPPFWGCCKSDPCSQNGCPTDDLSAANLGANPQAAVFYSPTGAASASASATPAGEHSNTAVIAAAVGGVVGGMLLLGVAVFFFWRRRRQNKQRLHGADGAEAEAKGRLADAGPMSPSHPFFFGGGKAQPPRYSTLQQHEEALPPTELDGSEIAAPPPSELMSEPVAPAELPAELPDSSSNASLLTPPLAKKRSRGGGKRFSGSSLSSLRPRPASRDSGAVAVREGAPEVSPQSATFSDADGDARYSTVSSLGSTPQIPQSPRQTPRLGTVEEDQWHRAG